MRTNALAAARHCARSSEVQVCVRNGKRLFFDFICVVSSPNRLCASAYDESVRLRTHSHRSVGPKLTAERCGARRVIRKKKKKTLRLRQTAEGLGCVERERTREGEGGKKVKGETGPADGH